VRQLCAAHHQLRVFGGKFFHTYNTWAICVVCRHLHLTSLALKFISSNMSTLSESPKSILITSVAAIALLAVHTLFYIIYQPQTHALQNTDAKDVARRIKNAVVHIGPYKTGSTTIQKHSKGLARQLRADGYGMPFAHTYTNGTRIRSSCNQVYVAMCFFQNGQPSQLIAKKALPCHNDLLEAGLDIGQNQHHSILLSAETFSALEEEGIKALHDYLYPTWENTIIIAYYRRYYDWIVSFHNQKSRQPFIKSWRRFQENSTDHLSLSLVNDLTYNHMLDYFRHKYVLSVIPRYKKYFSNVVVVNMHDQSMDLAERFYCELIPHATKTCEAVRNFLSTGNTLVENKSWQDDVYLELAYAAHRKGIIHVKTKEHCRDVVDAIQAYEEKTFHLGIGDFPRRCLPEAVLENIWEDSVQAEKEFGTVVSLDNHNGQDPLDVLKDDFDKKSKFELCEVDFDAILETAVWREFFEKHAPK
jgi:hypothetical protein